MTRRASMSWRRALMALVIPGSGVRVFEWVVFGRPHCRTSAGGQGAPRRGRTEGRAGRNAGRIRAMNVTAADFRRWYAPRKASFEWGFWIVTHVVNAVFNSAVRVMELAPGARDPQAWEPVVWECSSALSMLLLVWPVVWFTRAWPFRWDGAAKWLGGHLLASVVYSVAHVLLMVAMREVAYALADGDYSFGPWAGELFYEYLKDVRTYIGVVFLIEGYRFVLRRLSGEARWPIVARIQPARRTTAPAQDEAVAFGQQ